MYSRIHGAPSVVYFQIVSNFAIHFKLTILKTYICIRPHYVAWGPPSDVKKGTMKVPVHAAHDAGPLKKLAWRDTNIYSVQGPSGI